MKIKQVLQKASDVIGGFPISPAKIRAAGRDTTTFLKKLIDDLQKCTDAKDSKLVQVLIALRDEHEEEVTT